MESFDSGNNPTELTLWLAHHDVPADVCDIFEGEWSTLSRANAFTSYFIVSFNSIIIIYFYINFLFYSENEIDGDCFLELTESDIKGLVPKLGLVKKICRLQASVSFYFSM